MDKIEELCEQYGMTDDEMLETYALDSVVPGICSNLDCDYTTDVEPDCTDGWCEECSKGSVKSYLILKGMI